MRCISLNPDKVLIVSSKIDVQQFTWQFLNKSGILLYQATTLEKAYEMYSRISFDLFVFEKVTENTLGLQQFVQFIRSKSDFIPIIFIDRDLTEHEQLELLKARVSFFVAGSASIAVLEEHIINTLMVQRKLKNKNFYIAEETDLKLGAFRFNPKRYEFFIHNKLIPLSSKEVKIMELFMENPQQVFSKKEIYLRIWNADNFNDNMITVFINQLRKKIAAELPDTEVIKTIWGLGYMFEPE